MIEQAIPLGIGEIRIKDGLTIDKEYDGSYVLGLDLNNSNPNNYGFHFNAINIQGALPGQVLQIDEVGSPKWTNLFDDDTILREDYPALKESWTILMEALAEYEMVKKLVQDHE